MDLAVARMFYDFPRIDNDDESSPPPPPRLFRNAKAPSPDRLKSAMDIIHHVDGGTPAATTPTAAGQPESAEHTRTSTNARRLSASGKTPKRRGSVGFNGSNEEVSTVKWGADTSAEKYEKSTAALDQKMALVEELVQAKKKNDAKQDMENDAKDPFARFDTTQDGGGQRASSPGGTPVRLGGLSKHEAETVSRAMAILSRENPDNETFKGILTEMGKQ